MQPGDAPEGARAPTAADTSGADDQAPSDLTTGPAPRRTLWVSVLIGSLLAGLGSWACGEATFDYYKVSEKAARNLQDPNPMRKEMAVTVPRNVAIANGAQGALLGLLLGLVGGLARGGPRTGVPTGLVGMVGGGLVAVALSYLLVPVFQKHYDPAGDTLLVTTLTRAGIWSAIGAIAGAAFGWGLGRWQQVAHSFLLGFLGALIGTAAFELVNALLNPSDKNDQIIPTDWKSRLLAYLLVALFVGLGSAISVQGRGKVVTARDALADGEPGAVLPGKA